MPTPSTSPATIPGLSRSPAPGLSRRAVLRTSAVAGLGSLVLAACSQDATEPAPALQSGTPSEVDLEQEIVDALRAAGFGDSTPDYTAINATFEVLTGPGRRLQIGVLDETGQPVLDGDLQIAIVRSGDLEVVQRIDGPRFYGEGLGQRGVYVFETDLPNEAIYYLFAQVDGHVGATSMIARDPANSQILAIGAAIPSLQTPTVDDEMGLAQLCTRDPDCSMHDLSLDAALELGKPIVLVVASPLYCQTAVCGPVVDVVEGIKAEADPADLTYIHAEVFTDAGNTPTDIINALQLPSEPWTFLVNSDGSVADRFDGPVVPDLLREAVAELS